MNGVAINEDERMTNKRKLEADLALIRSQKAEVLRSIQQISKKQKLGGPPTEVQHRSHEAKVQHAKLEHERRKELIFATCIKIIQELLKNHNVKQIFLNPVSREIYPQYYITIKRPICLSDIKAKLDVKGYPDIYTFRDDMRLIWQNCRSFNPPGEVVRKYGDNASDQFEQKFLKYHVEASWEAEKQRFNLDMARLDAEAKTLPDKLKEVDAELQDLARKVNERENPSPPGPGREMTFEEKRKLSHALGTLPGERLTRVLEIIAEGPSAPQMESEEEYELDIDALDSETLWKLQAYVDAVSSELAAKTPKPPAPVNTENNAATANNNTAAPASAAAAEAVPPPPVPIEDQVKAEGGGAGPRAVGNAPAKVVATGTEGTGAGTGSESNEGVGSKDNDGSAQDGPEPREREDVAKRPHDMTTFVSATGPGAAPAILKNTGQKKDIQLQNAGAWAPLTAPAPPPPPTSNENTNPDNDTAPAPEEDNLWTEFQGREEQQLQAEEQKKQLEEEEKKKKEAEAEDQRAAAAAAELKKVQEEDEKRKKEEEERVKMEAERAAVAKELEVMKSQGEEEHHTDLMRHAEHRSAADLEELGLGQQDDEEPEPMEEI